MIYLIAGNGAPNFGDELIVANWLRYYREMGYNGPLVVDGKGARATEQLLRGYGDVRFVKGIPRHAEGVEGSYTDFYSLGVDFAIQQLHEFQGIKGIHCLGGGYASANWNNATKLLGSAAEIGRLLDIPVVATGLGISPFNLCEEADRTTWQRILNSFRIFECRDAESYTDLLSLVGREVNSLTLGLDDAFLYPVKAQRHSGKWLHLSGFTAKIFNSDSSEAFEKLMGEFDNTAFWSCSKPDQLVYEELLKLYPDIQLLDNERLLNNGLPLMQADFMITGRFHPHMQAARRGLHGYYIAESGFYRTKHGLVAELGSPFKQLEKSLEFFDSPNSLMSGFDRGRVESKRRVGFQILRLFDIETHAVAD